MTAEEFKMLPAIPPNRRPHLPNGQPTPNRQPSTKGDEAIFIAKCFEYLKRYLDDILSMNNPLFTRLMKEDQTLLGFHGIYPKELDIEASKLATSTPFLDILIRCSLRNNHNLETLHYSKFDGKEYAKLHRPLSPARHSNIAIGQKQGVIKGRLTTLSRHVSVRHNFVQQAGILATIFENKHYDIATIRTLIQRWIHSKRGLLYGTSPHQLTRLFLHELQSQQNKRSRK